MTLLHYNNVHDDVSSWISSLDETYPGISWVVSLALADFTQNFVRNNADMPGDLQGRKIYRSKVTEDVPFGQDVSIIYFLRSTELLVSGIGLNRLKIAYVLSSTLRIFRLD